MNPNSHANSSAEIHEGDIVFDCPYCGHNLAIEPAGSGLMVPCAGCGRAVQVPVPDASTPSAPIAGVDRPVVLADEDPRDIIRQLDIALARANEQIEALLNEREALQERRSFLEQMKVTTAIRQERIASELATVQDALDRAMALLAEMRSEKPV